MSDYVKSVNFAAKDALTTGDSNKLVKGTEIDTEYNNAATSSATKANKISGGSDNDIVAQDTNGDIKNGAVAIINAIYPVGSIYISTVSTNPGTTFGTGTWVALGDKQTLVQAGTYSAGSTGGSSTAVNVSHGHTDTFSLASDGDHTHDLNSRNTISGGSVVIVDEVRSLVDTTVTSGAISTAGAHTHTINGSVDSSGSSGTDANMPPYLSVYIWKRTA